MRRRVGIGLGFVALLAVIPVLVTVLTPAASTNSPYLSALSNLGGPNALAAKPNPCARTGCDPNTNMTSCIGQIAHECKWYPGHKVCHTVPC